jgi:hypothetical protein
MTLVTLAFLEATRPPGMPMMGTSTDPGVAGALRRRTTILATLFTDVPMVGPTETAEPQSGRNRETKPPYLVVPEPKDGHGATETNPVVVGTVKE